MQSTGTGYKLFMYFKNASDSLMKEIMCNILYEFSTATKIVVLIKLCFTRDIMQFPQRKVVF
jgi:hypothetical protein